MPLENNEFAPPIRRALISVSDKSGLVELAQALTAASVEIFSTGGTRRHLEESGLAIRDIADYTGFPEMMDGRLKTLHPKVFGGILCRHDRRDDMAAIQDFEIVPFELVVVNLYPFEATIQRPGVTPAEAIEQIDIGGPSLVRAAAKNHAFVTIATSPHQYTEIREQLAEHGGTSLALRQRLAAAAFARTADYDQSIAGYFAAQDDAILPPSIRFTLSWHAPLRYGENPHQRAGVYRLPGAPGASLVGARQLNGKELSFNNLLDLDSALAIVRSWPDPTVSVIKHNNPCGAATAADLRTATERAMAGDPLSAFGGVLGFNCPVDAATAEFLVQPGLFIEAMAAPDFEPLALELLTTRPKWRQNVRLIATGDPSAPSGRRQVRFIDGGALVQEVDGDPDPESSWRVVTDKTVPEPLWNELRFAWAMVRHVRSNAIVLARDTALCGVGAGQMSRVDAVEIAIRKAGQRAHGSVLASDAFFPFPDSIHKAAEAGVSAVIQPGGSVKDAEVIAACQQHGIAMIFTDRRHFKH
ncbi:MAG: bifunctional phosphoribosylaminoimidazolecarboxamide formyltransferase/IMP cyclohydrolase [Pirellulaceae bacterium]